MSRIEDFDYHLPPELVAQYPRAQRDSSRLLVVRRQGGEIQHAGFRDLARWLDPRDLLVVNDTRVFPARLQGRKESGGRVELLLHHLPVAEEPAEERLGEGQPAPLPSPKPLPTPYRGGRMRRVGELIALPSIILQPPGPGPPTGAACRWARF
jgi:S-adenosylmethionine:tRNA ribosyltransferase-isomerase